MEEAKRGITKKIEAQSTNKETHWVLIKNPSPFEIIEDK